MVVSDADFLVGSAVSLRGLVGLLPQHGDGEFLDGSISSADCLRLDFWRDLRSADVSCLEAQSLDLRATMRSVGPLFHLRALWHRQRSQQWSLPSHVDIGFENLQHKLHAMVWL